MLNPDPEKRITLEEIKNSDWYSEATLSQEEVIEIMTSKKLEMEGDQDMELDQTMED